MRDAEDVTVERTVVHIIKHLKQELVYSEAELDLAENDKLREYFSDQVKNALRDAQTGSARFSTEGNQTAIQECQAILTDVDHFIPSSKKLASLLLEAMGKDERIKPPSSCLAVCIYTAANYPSAKFLALIKIDPGEALIERIDTRNGKQIVTFKVLPDVLPTKDVKLRKTALIPPKGIIKNLDLLLLDRQVAGVAANFFAVKFLNALEVLDPRASAKNFLFAAEKARKILESAPEEAPEHIGPEQADAYVRHTEAALLSPSVHRVKFVENLPLPAPALKVVTKQLEKQFPEDTRIKIDPKYARDTLLKRRRYVGRYGVSFEVDSEYFDEVVRPQKDKKLPDGTIVTRWIIEVPDFRRVR